MNLKTRAMGPVLVVGGVLAGVGYWLWQRGGDEENGNGNGGEPDTAAIAGVVYDEQTEEQVINAHVSLNGYTVMTDSEGTFLLAGLVPGMYVLVVTADGYEPLEANVELFAGEVLETDVGLVAITSPPPPPVEPELLLSNLVIEPWEIMPGATVQIKVTATNIGDSQIGFENPAHVALMVNGEVVNTQEVQLAAGDSMPVQFTVQADLSGVYVVEVDGLSGSFKVLVESPVINVVEWWCRPNLPPADPQRPTKTCKITIQNVSDAATPYELKAYLYGRIHWGPFKGTLGPGQAFSHEYFMGYLEWIQVYLNGAILQS